MPAQRRSTRRLLRALNASLAFVLLLVAMFAAQGAFDWRALGGQPHGVAGLLGVLTAPLLHGSLEHLVANAVALLMLGTLAGSVYPRATRARAAAAVAGLRAGRVAAGRCRARTTSAPAA